MKTISLGKAKEVLADLKFFTSYSYPTFISLETVTLSKEDYTKLFNQIISKIDKDFPQFLPLILAKLCINFENIPEEYLVKYLDKIAIEEILNILPKSLLLKDIIQEEIEKRKDKIKLSNFKFAPSYIDELPKNHIFLRLKDYVNMLLTTGPLTWENLDINLTIKDLEQKNGK